MPYPIIGISFEEVLKHAKLRSPQPFARKAWIIKKRGLGGNYLSKFVTASFSPETGDTTFRLYTWKKIYPPDLLPLGLREGESLWDITDNWIPAKGDRIAYDWGGVYNGTFTHFG